MLTLSQDIKTFQAYCRTGRVPDLKSLGSVRTVNESEMQAILSITRNALSDGLGKPLGAEVIMTSDILGALPTMARERAERLGLHRPGEYARGARVFAQTILTARHADTRRPVGSPALVPVDPNEVPAGFRMMYDALESLVRKDPSWRAMRGAFRDCARLFVEHGVLAPEGVKSRKQFDDLADKRGLSTARRNHLLSGWRKAREQAQRLDLTDLKQTSRMNSNGMSGCEHVPQALRMLPFHAQIETLAGDLATMRTDYVTKKSLSPESLKTLDGALSWMVAEIIRVELERNPVKPGEPGDLDFLQTFDPITLFLTAHGDARAMTPAETLRASKSQGTASPTAVSVMRHLVDRIAARSSADSDLLLKREGKIVKGGVWYTQAIFADLSAIRRFIYEFIGSTLEASSSVDDQAQWQRVEKEYKDMVTSMRAHNALVGDLTNHRDKSRLPATWPQLVFIGLPALRARVIAARRAWDDCGTRNKKRDSRLRRSLWLTYEKRMIEYVVYAVLLADGMRIANYAGALTGGRANVDHVQVRLKRDDDGTPCGVLGVSVVFRRNDTPLVRLKKRDAADVRDRERPKTLEPGLVDFDLLWSYLAEVRPTRLKRRRIKGAEAFDIERDGFAFFVAGMNGPNKQNLTGGFTEDQLGGVFGATLHYVCVEVLKLNEREGLLRDEIIPSWAELANVKQWKQVDLETYQRLSLWRSLFAPHIVRNLYNVYFYGVRQNIALAMRTTDDTLKVIVDNYNVYAKDVERHMHDKGPSNPKWFDAAVDEIIRPARPGDNWPAFWKAMDPCNPNVAVAALQKT